MNSDFIQEDDSLDFEKLRQWTEEQGGKGWIFDFPQRAADLFEALPERCTFDALLHEADRLGISGEEAVEYYRLMQREEMLIAAGEDDWRKNEDARPYF